MESGSKQLPREDLTGKQFGSWKVLAPAPNYKWLCECQCPLHTRREVLASSLKRGISVSCGNREYHPVSQKSENKEIKRTPDELKVKHWSEEAKQNRANKVNIYAIGNLMGDWEILDKLDTRNYRCRCTNCGFEKTLTTSGLWNAKKNNFKCNHSHKQLKGEWFGQLEVIEEKGFKTCICKCHNCGKTIEVRRNNLLLGHYISCGCLRSQSKFSREDFESAVMAYKLEHNGLKPQPVEIAEKLGLGMSSTYKNIKKYDLENQFEVHASKGEKEVALLFDNIENVQRRTRTVLEHYELDIYLPDYKTAIEYNGDFWHSALIKEDMKYHQSKTLEAAANNIRLIHIFEHEWKKNNEIIKNFLLDIIRDKKIYHARKLEIKEVSTQEINRFYSENHLQGKINGSKVNIALVENDEILSAISMGTPRFDNKYQWEIYRYCTKFGVVISGGIERMYKYFEGKYKPTDVVTYADASKFNGQVYKKIGFKYLGITTPNYKWVHPTQGSLSRYKTQKHKLIELGLGTEEQTEVEIMTNLNYFKVYDCGNFKYEKRYK